MDIHKHSGLSIQQAKELLFSHGRNTITSQKKTSVILLFFSQYKNIMTAILAFAASFSFLVSEYVDGLFIAFVLLANGFFGFLQEYRAERTIEKLKDLSIPLARVVREGAEHEIPSDEIVPGDIVVVREGDRIPSDGKLLSTTPLEVDESIFTGESFPVEKKKDDTVALGTFIVRGRGYYETVATGNDTKLGHIASEIEHIQKPKTPLAIGLAQFGKKIALVVFLLSPVLIPLGIFQGMQLRELILTSISIAVAVIPEGLPLVVTIALAVGAFRMAQVRTIVRKMDAIETLGATNVILTDKTGTLTQNNMSIKKYWIASDDLKPLFLRSLIVGNTATLALSEDGSFDIIGDKTDGAFLLFARDHIKNFDEYVTEGKIIFEKPFDPATKTIETEWEYERKKYLFIRGAPELIIKNLSKKNAEHIEKKIHDYAAEGLRVIAFAYHHKDTFELLGLVGIYDPPRKEAASAIERAHSAGVRVVMVTGDNPLTALKISEEIGLVEKDDIVLTSNEIKVMSDEELVKQFDRVRVYARMQPGDKLRLVRLYKKAGYVVAVTGDGVNDALALADANIGVAMGKSGTDVAKEAADIVVTDDNLSTIVRAIGEGRSIFANITKAVVVLVATNAAEFGVIFLSILFGLPVVFSPTQILWINLVTDSIPAMALATDSYKKGLLQQKPRNIYEHIINKKRLQLILLISIPLSIITIAFYKLSLTLMPITDARLFVFNAFVLVELFVIIFVRGGIFPINRLLLAAIALIIVLQFIIILQPWLRQIFI